MHGIDEVMSAQSTEDAPKVKTEGEFVVKITKVGEFSATNVPGGYNWPINFEIVQSNNPEITTGNNYAYVEKSYRPYQQGQKNMKAFVASLHGIYPTNNKMIDNALEGSDYHDVTDDEIQSAAGVLVKLTTSFKNTKANNEPFLRHLWNPLAPGRKLPKEDDTALNDPPPIPSTKKVWKKHPDNPQYAYCGTDIRLIDDLSDEEREGLS